MHVGKNESSSQNLKEHDTNMIPVSEIDYLGEVISSDAKNTKKCEKWGIKRH